MKKNFLPGWISCLDESMSAWLNKFTCPGFMCVPRKPWPFGNEWHTIACGICGIIYQAELVEGKDEPKCNRGPKEFDELGKTVGLLLHLTKSIWGTAKIVVLNSGFCVLQGVIELKKGVSLQQHLSRSITIGPNTKYFPGDKIIEHFKNKDIGYVDALPGVLDDIPFHIFGMKEPNYVMQIMSTYGMNEQDGDMKKRAYKVHGKSRQTAFQYPEVVHNHYRYRHVVDDHNAKTSLTNQFGGYVGPQGVATLCLCSPSCHHRSQC